MRNDGRDELDEVIDRALAGYSAAAPLEGLEERVLARARRAGRPRRWPWVYGLGFALAAAAAAVIVVIAWWPAPVAPPKPRPAESARNLVVNPPVAGGGVRRVAQRKSRVRRAARPLPKQEVFPAPAPMTEEERTLAAWVRRAPNEARGIFADLDKRSRDPVAIQAIEIAPLEQSEIP